MNKEIKLEIGTKIKIGKKYAQEFGFKSGDIVELVEGHFDEDNGLYTHTSTAPSLWDEEANEFNSIYHLFGNDLEYFMDCMVIDSL